MTVMADFTVMGVFDGNTFAVSPNWEWQGQKGYCVRASGYDVPKPNGSGSEVVKDKLASLILENAVNLRIKYRIIRPYLVCDVYFQGKNLADYFPEYKT